MIDRTDFQAFVSTIDTLLFDMDGTLFDLNVDWMNIKLFIAQKYEERHGTPLPFTSFLPLFHYLQDNQMQEDVQIYMDYLKMKELEGASQFAEPTWLIKERWDQLRNINPSIKNFGIVSSNFHQTVLAVLEKYNMHNQFQIIIGRDDVQQLKPFPEGLLKCLDYFKTAPERCLYVGDMPSDGDAAGKANMHYIDITELKKILKNLN
jgi:HAD superfamily hydrolase (TIGR01549 family)